MKAAADNGAAPTYMYCPKTTGFAPFLMYMFNVFIIFLFMETNYFRINMATGKKEAKLLDPNEGNEVIYITYEHKILYVKKNSSTILKLPKPEMQSN